MILKIGKLVIWLFHILGTTVCYLSRCGWPRLCCMERFGEEWRLKRDLKSSEEQRRTWRGVDNKEGLAEQRSGKKKDLERSGE